jgi:RimJ/RimL family protein N-acetyltransferase
MYQGEKTTLRPVEQADLPVLESWTNDLQVQGPFNIFGLEGKQGKQADFAKSGFLGQDQGMLLVIAEDKVVGMVAYRPAIYGPHRAAWAYAIGVHIVPEARGQGLGAEAQSLLASYLFDTYPINRVEAETDVENVAEQRALEKAGFQREGVLRGAQWRAGAWHDLAVFSKLRGE